MPKKPVKKRKALKPLEAIKSLLILDLYLKNVSTKEIGALLGTSYKTIERLIPAGLKHDKKSKK